MNRNSLRIFVNQQNYRFSHQIIRGRNEYYTSATW